jgi:hypothetical protein
MVAIPLTAGAYTASTLTANAQRSINLFSEINPPETKPVMPFTQYPRPGLAPLSLPPVAGHGRCLYATSTGGLYAVIDQAVYFINPDFVFRQIGSLLTDSITPASIVDNGVTGVIVDNSPFGYQFNLATPHAFSQISDPNFYGSTRADFLDSFIVFNRPGTNQWYCTPSDAITPFNALAIGIKTAWPDPILAIVTIERNAWIFGPKKSEVWYNAGATPFPFQTLPGNIIEQGCAAAYSPAKSDTNVYWLSQAPEGDRMVMRGNALNVAQRISTHAIESEWRTYPRIDDAIGATYQVQGHFFYKITFPTADKTWGWDETTKQWHEDNWIDTNGVLHRARNTFCTFAYGKNLGLDWATGALYNIDPNTTTDNGIPIILVRGFPHQLNELRRVNWREFTADVAVGESVATGEQRAFLRPWSDGFNAGFGPMSSTPVPQIAMRMSRNGGYQFGNYRIHTLIGSGHYRSIRRWRGIGASRDAVFEISSTAQMLQAINGAYIDPLVGMA